MISIIPVLLLITASILLQILGRVKFPAGKTWLISSIVAVFTWVSMILIRIMMPSGWLISGWLPGKGLLDSIVFQFTEETWVFGFLLISLMVAVIFYEARLLESGYYVNILTGTMALSAFGLMSILSGSGLTFLLSWVMIDIAEFTVLTGILKEGSKHQIAVTSLFTRTIGVFLLILVLVLQSQDGSLSLGNGESPLIGVLVVIVAVLRMGIIPTHMPYSEDPKIRRGIGSILRFTPILSVFSFLLAFGPQEFSQSQTNWIVMLFTTAAVFGSVSWYLSQNELSGRPYWIFTLGCLALIGYVRSLTDVIIGVAIMMVAGGAGLFLPSTQKRGARFFIPLLVVGMLCIPYTPTAMLPRGLWGEQFTFSNLFIILSISLLISGWILHAFNQKDETEQYESWVWLFQMMALVFMTVAPWIIGLFFLEKASDLHFWWYAVILSIVIGLILTVNFYRKHQGNKIAVFYMGIKRGINPILSYIDRFFRFEWVIQIIKGLGKLVSVSMRLLVRVLEGDGGILWSFLFLVLLASLLISGQR